MPEKTLFTEENPMLLDQCISMVESGGPVMAILLLMSLFGLTVFLLKLVQLRLSHIRDFEPIQHAVVYWKQQQRQQARDALSGCKNPAANMVEIALNGIRDGHPLELVREEVRRVAHNAIETLRRYLRALELIASLSPLMGLFGTVIGIIEAFHQMELAGANVDPSQLSGGIWVALLTTATGLAVGMPAVVALNYLESRVEHFTHQAENLVTQVFTASLYPLEIPSVKPLGAEEMPSSNTNQDLLWTSKQLANQGS